MSFRYGLTAVVHLHPHYLLSQQTTMPLGMSPYPKPLQVVDGQTCMSPHTCTFQSSCSMGSVQHPASIITKNLRKYHGIKGTCVSYRSCEGEKTYLRYNWKNNSHQLKWRIKLYVWATKIRPRGGFTKGIAICKLMYLYSTKVSREEFSVIWRYSNK